MQHGLEIAHRPKDRTRVHDLAFLAQLVEPGEGDLGVVAIRREMGRAGRLQVDSQSWDRVFEEVYSGYGSPVGVS